MREPPFEIRNRAELVDALSVAAQVEHVVLVEYLYAAFSCRHTHDPSVPVAAQMVSWEAARELYLIAHDEMDHLGAVQQLLAALGAPPVPDAFPFPIRDERLPFPCELTRLDAAAVDRFIQTESPPVSVEAAVAEPPDPIRFDLLGDLYRAIIAGIQRLGDDVFIGAPVTGTDPSPLTFSQEGFPVATAADAIASLEKVIIEGEGGAGPGAGGGPGAGPGHFARFETMRENLDRLGADAASVSWPCVPNPVLQEGGAPGTTLLTRPSTVQVADIANRAYRSLWLLLGGTYIHDWSPSDEEVTVQRRQRQRIRSMRAARWLMATVLRPLGEILARLPAFEGEAGGDGGRGDGDGGRGGGDGRPTAGMCFEQYGEFRVPAQPDARAAATVDELDSIAADLDVVAGNADLSAPWAGPRLAAVAADVRMIRERFLGRVPPPAKNQFEPPAGGRWLSVDFEGWYQVRLATGGDPYNDPRGVSGWQYALPGEPDMDRVLRFQPEGAFLRPQVDPGIAVGVTVTSAAVAGEGPVSALHGARVELLGESRFEGHNGAVAADGDEPIVPCHLRISADGVVLQRDAVDAYQLPYLDVTSLGGFGDLPAARALRARHGLPEEVFGPQGLTPEMREHLLAARDRLVAAISAAQAAGDEDAVL
ncbi:MAG: ferritin-like protein, partial [Actinomycetota bacterium]|nr:ferritin-like protein [Actinomycetota bacterium]